MAQMTAQEIFDKVATHLLKQGRKAEATTNGSCKYRTDDGLKCAAGCLIPDEEYSVSFECISWRRAARVAYSNEDNSNLQKLGKIAVRIGQVELVADLQVMHDDTLVEDWPSELRRVADDFSLSAAVLDAFTKE